MLTLHFFKKLLCPCHYLRRQSRQLRNVNAVALIHATADYLSQEAYGTTVLVNGYAVILHALQLVLKAYELMVMSGEKRLAAQFL